MRCAACSLEGEFKQWMTFSFWFCPGCKQEIVASKTAPPTKQSVEEYPQFEFKKDPQTGDRYLKVQYPTYMTFYYQDPTRSYEWACFENEHYFIDWDKETVRQ